MNIKKNIHIFKNKYFIATTFFILWIVFFDQNNLIDRVQNIYKYRQMQDAKIYYLEKIKADKKKLNELRTDRENLEKFAREQYFMKKDDEDVYIVVE